MLSALRLPPTSFKDTRRVCPAVSAIISFTLLQLDSEQVGIQSKHREQKRKKKLIKTVKAKKVTEMNTDNEMKHRPL